MGLTGFFSKIVHEFKVLAGNRGKDKLFTQSKTYFDLLQAKEGFEKSRQKLLNVNGWSDMKGINSTFQVHDLNGNPVSEEVREGFYIKIELPGANVENWVQVSNIKNEPDLAEFIVHPSKKPEEKSDPNAEVKHFFTQEASSTFRVIRQGNTIKAFEIGRNEVINNSGDAGNRALLNTLIAEGGWAGFQKIQWEKLTRYLVHLEENE